MANFMAITADITNSRLLLDLVWDGTYPTISRMDPDGVWRFVRGANPGNLTSGGWSGADFEAPLDVSTYYYVTDGTSTLTSATAMLLSDGVTWLKHLTKPARSMKIYPTRPPEVTSKASGGVFDILGRSAPVAVTDVRRAVVGTLEVVTATDAERTALWKLLSDGSILQLASPVVMGLSGYYVAVGDVVEQRMLDYAPDKTRTWQIPFTVVAQPR